MKRILFVDDEQHALDELRNLLHRHRHEWEMVFTRQPRVALAQVREAPFDVVVSDMRMPELDGASFLEQVKDLNPAAARIVLSEEAEHGAIVRALPVAHRYLRKPCDLAVLESAIQRACVFQNLLRDEAMLGIVGRIEALPSVSNTYWELTRAMARADAGSAELARIVEKDPAMSIKLLQIVNSAFFGLAQRVSSIQHAISYLGTELLRSLVMTTEVFAAAECISVDGFSLERFQADSLATATLARRLLARSPRADDAFTAALVHDVGKLLIALAVPDRCERVLREVARSCRPVHVVEHEILGTTHADVGSYLLGVWGLPPRIVETAMFHHSPSQCTAGELEVLAAVHLADAFVDAGCGDGALGAPEKRLDEAFLGRAVAASELDRWMAIAREARASTAEPRAPLPARRDEAIESKDAARDRRSAEDATLR
jgi:HD-like signal output (HDOD) protein